MRKPPLEHDPEIRVIGMPTLVGIANAIEHESIRRYEQLAKTMQRRGESETAEAFRTMLDEERSHLEGVQRWARSLGVPVPPHEAFEWSLPADLSASWDDIAGSALLTPYRAFAIAVDNEQRAFSFYAYLAAHASDARVAREAENLAAEELRHAARVRRWRRAAWHRERPSTSSMAHVTTIEGLRAFLDARHAGIAARHRAIAARLAEIGDAESAQLLESLLTATDVSRSRVGQASEASHASHASHAGEPVRNGHPGDAGHDAAHDVDRDGDRDGVGDAADESGLRAIPETNDPVHLLVAAQKPLESLIEALESILASAEGDLFGQAEKAATEAVARLARISLQTDRRMHSAQAG